MSSLRYTSLGIMRPPKPPCWRDFIVSSPKSINSDVVDVPDSTGRAVGARSPVTDLMENSRVAVSLPGNKPSRLARRPRARIHRTRSEHVIQVEDLPESIIASTLADTDPKGLRVRVPEGPLYVEENTRRCQNWLAGIEAAEPLDKVDYTVDKQTSITQDKEIKNTQSGSLHKKTTADAVSESPENIQKATLLIYELQQEVDVEIPEESFGWDASRNPQCQSLGSDDEMSSACKDTTSLEDCEKSSEIQGCSLSASPARSVGSPKSNAASLTRCLLSSTDVSPSRSPGSPKSNTASPAPCLLPPTSSHISPTRFRASPAQSSVSTTRNQVSPARSLASSIHNAVFPAQSPVSPTSSPVSRVLNSIPFTRSPVSPISSCRELTDNSLKARHRHEHANCENSSNNCTATIKTAKCDKKTSDRKRHKLCCDFDHTDSSSGTDDSFRCHLTCGEDEPANKGFQDKNSRPHESQRSTTPKLLSDSELFAFNLSTCD